MVNHTVYCLQIAQKQHHLKFIHINKFHLQFWLKAIWMRSARSLRGSRARLRFAFDFLLFINSLWLFARCGRKHLKPSIQPWMCMPFCVHTWKLNQWLNATNNEKRKMKRNIFFLYLHWLLFCFYFTRAWMALCAQEAISIIFIIFFCLRCLFEQFLILNSEN